MKLSQIAVKRPVTMLMMVMIIVLLGSISLGELPIDLLPDIEAPVIAVQTSYADAGPFEIENFVTRPIEEALASVNNVSQVSSVSSRGNSVVIAQFDWGLNMDFVALDVRERVDLVRGLLPDDAGSPVIVKFDPTDMPIMELVVTGDVSLADLRYAADNTVKNRLERLEGVASVSVTGGQEREVQVNLHPGLMQTHKVSLDSVAQVLAAANLNLPAGTVADGGLAYILRTTGEYSSVEEIRQQRIPNAEGVLIPLHVIADVEDGFKPIQQLSRYQGLPSVLLTVQKEAAANSVDVAARVREAMHGINDELGQGIAVAVAQDLTIFIQESVQAVAANALFGGTLAMLVLLVFLRSMRPTLIIAFAIPVSVLFTFALMFFFDISINMISLGGLALGVGMLVDNAIVVLENVFRHKEEGYDSDQAAELGAQQVSTAIMASTLTTVSVFLPVVFIAGIAAEIFRDMALTVTFALAASLLISLTLVPMLGSKLLPSRELPEIAFLKPVRRGMTRLQTWYGGTIRMVLRRRLPLVMSMLVMVGLSGAMVPLIGMEFLPDFDQGEIQIDVMMPRGTELHETDSVVRRLEEFAFSLPDVALVYSSMGSGGRTGQRGSESGRIGIILRPRSQRVLDTSDVIRELRAFSAQVPGADITISGANMLGMFFGEPVQLNIRGDDIDQMEIAANAIVERISRIPGIVDPVSSLEEREPELQIQVNRQRAAESGVTVAQIASALRTSVSGSTVTRFRSEGREVDVTVRLAEAWRNDPTAVMNVPMQTPRGIKPLSELADVQAGTSPVSVQRSDRSRIVTVSAQLEGLDLSTANEAMEEALAQLSLPPGVSFSFGGESEEMLEAFGQLSLALILGVLLVFMILASQFESLAQPIIIMITLPLAVIGVVLGLLLMQVTFSVVAFVGAIMLAGIVVNNAIVMVDYINQLRAQGRERTDAIAEAGEVRLRPILMTSLTTILAMIPMAIGFGEGQELQRPIAVVVIGGLVTSTFLTLFVIPAFYTYVDDFEQWVAGKLFPKEVH